MLDKPQILAKDHLAAAAFNLVQYPRVGAIWAQAAGAAGNWQSKAGGGVIGEGGTMPWHVPADLKWFSKLTSDSTVIMGRRTWESLPSGFRPLPQRQNIVISSTLSDANLPGARVVKSLAQALEIRAKNHAWIIGGGRLYREALSICSVVAITQLNIEVSKADTFAPQLDESWQQLAKTDAFIDAGVTHCFTLWQKTAS